MSFFADINSYRGWFLSLTRKFYSNGRFNFLSSVFLFLFGQVCLVLSFFLPLKVIILIGTDGIPRYLRAFVNQDNKEQYVAIFAFLTVVFYVLYHLSDTLISRFAQSSSKYIITKAKKLHLLEDQVDYVKDIFIRSVRSWGTLAMVLLGFIFGFAVEWRIFLFLTVITLIEMVVYDRFWTYSLKPQNVAFHRKLIKNQTTILSALSAFNFFSGFISLYILFSLGYIDSFLVGILLILLIRQIYQRSVLSIGDATFLSKNRNTITGVLFVSSYLEKTENKIHRSFESMLSPDLRGKILEFDSKSGVVFTTNDWDWVDSSEKKTALYTCKNKSDTTQYWLKLYPLTKKGAYEKSLFIYSILNDNGFRYAPKCLDFGWNNGLYYILLSTPHEVLLDQVQKKRKLRKWIFETWKYQPPRELIDILSRSIPPLSRRINRVALEKMKIAAISSNQKNQLKLIINSVSKIESFIESMPTFVRNDDILEIYSLFHNDGSFSFLHWHEVYIEPIFSNVKLKEIDNSFIVRDAVKKIKNARNDCSEIEESDIYKIVYLSNLDKFLDKKRYGAALALLPYLIELFNE